MHCTGQAQIILFDSSLAAGHLRDLANERYLDSKSGAVTRYQQCENSRTDSAPEWIAREKLRGDPMSTIFSFSIIKQIFTNDF